jgi:hypothetical protein
MPYLHDVREGQRGQRERAHHLHILRTDEHGAAVAAVGNHAADQREEHDGDLAEEAVEAQVKRVFREFVDQPALRHGLHPGADGGGTGSDPHQPEIAILESLEDALQHLR